jgi:hypothetical protein
MPSLGATDAVQCGVRLDLMIPDDISHDDEVAEAFQAVFHEYSESPHQATL